MEPGKHNGNEFRAGSGLTLEPEKGSRPEKRTRTCLNVSDLTVERGKCGTCKEARKNQPEATSRWNLEKRLDPEKGAGTRVRLGAAWQEDLGSGWNLKTGQARTEPEAA